MVSKLMRNNTVHLSDWQLFTNNGNFNNPLPPNRRVKRRQPYFVLEIDTDYVRDRCSTARSRNQSAISTSTRRILSSRSVNYRRPPRRVKPIDFDLDEQCDKTNVYPSTKLKTRRISAASSYLSTPQAWSFSCLHRAIIAIDEQAKKDYGVGRTMNALSAWQNALIFCDELSQRNQLWPENKAALDEEIATLRRTYKQHMEEIMRENKSIHHGKTFLVPTRKCTACLTEQPLDQFHDRFSKVCQHVERTICNKCIYNKAKSLLETSNKTEITCPEPHCTAKFNLKQIRQLLSHGSAENLNRQSKNQPLERKTEFILCAHEGCDSGQFHIMSQLVSPIVTCVLCKRQTCAIHRVQWHKGMTCNEYDQQQKELLNTVKQCPKCRFNVKRDPVSDRVICSQCKLEFCWECTADYKQIERKGPQLHKTTCSHYENNAKKQASKSSACTIL